jgi:Protein of unknown function (DUF2283).
MKIEYDRRVDAAYVSFSAAASTRQEKLDDARIIDYDANGTVVGVEFIAPSLGLDLTGVPRAAEIAREARKVGLRVRLAPSSA